MKSSNTITYKPISISNKRVCQTIKLTLLYSPDTTGFRKANFDVTSNVIHFQFPNKCVGIDKWRISVKCAHAYENVEISIKITDNSI